jgi:hypothetical protein
MNGPERRDAAVADGGGLRSGWRSLIETDDTHGVGHDAFNLDPAQRMALYDAIEDDIDAHSVKLPKPVGGIEAAKLFSQDPQLRRIAVELADAHACVTSATVPAPVRAALAQLADQIRDLLRGDRPYLTARPRPECPKPATVADGQAA